MAFQPGQGLGGETRKGRPAEIMGHGPAEVLGQEGQIPRPRAQRRDGHHVEGQAVQEVVAEGAGSRGGRQVDVGGADHPHVDPERLGAADPLHLAVLDHAQDLLLDGEARVGDLVEQQGPPVGQLETADAPTLGTGEGPGLVAEELGLDQGLGDRRAVQLDLRAVPTRREKVQALGHQLLARPPFAHDQNRPVERRDAGDLLQKLEKRPGLADRRGQVSVHHSHYLIFRY